MELAEFLAARYHEAEALALAAKGDRWYPNAHPGRGWQVLDAPDWKTATLVAWSPGPMGSGPPERDEPTSRHIAANDPAHRLADIKLKRAILALHRLTVTKAETYRFDSFTGEPIPERFDGDCEICGWFDPETGGCATVRQLATEFSGHPSYKETWKP